MSRYKPSTVFTQAELKAAEFNAATTAIVNILMDVYSHTRDATTVSRVAKAWGLNPVGKEERKFLRSNKSVGRERANQFLKLLEPEE